MMVMVVRPTPYNYVPSFDIYLQGATVARYAGQNVHKRLIKEEAYHEKNYEIAMKRAFLGTDEDILAGQFFFVD
jgi:hypothetical protein